MASVAKGRRCQSKGNATCIDFVRRVAAHSLGPYSFSLTSERHASRQATPFVTIPDFRATVLGHCFCLSVYQYLRVFICESVCICVSVSVSVCVCVSVSVCYSACCVCQSISLSVYMPVFLCVQSVYRYACLPQMYRKSAVPCKRLFSSAGYMLTFRLPSYFLWHRLPRGGITTP